MKNMMKTLLFYTRSMNNNFLFGNASHSTLQTLSKITSLVLAFLFFITPLAPAFAQEASAPLPEQGSTSEQTPAPSEQPATQPDTPDAQGKKSEAATPDTATPDDTKDDKQKEPKKPTEPPVVTALTSGDDLPVRDDTINRSPHLLSIDEVDESST